MPTVSATHTAPIRLSSGVASASATSSTGSTACGRCSSSASSGATTISGSDVVSQCTAILQASSSERGCGASTSCSSEPSS